MAMVAIAITGFALGQGIRCDRAEERIERVD
jgi:hypothetical protein